MSLSCVRLGGLQLFQLADEVLAHCAVTHCLIALDAVLKHHDHLVLLFHCFCVFCVCRVSANGLNFLFILSYFQVQR